MKNKYSIGTMIKYKNLLEENTFAEIQSITEHKDFITYNIEVGGGTMHLKEQDILASYSQDSVRKPRTTAKKSKASKEKVQAIDNANETKGEN